MREDLLHYIWKMKRFDWSDLRTTEGQHVEILHFGIHNHDAGPDFLEGKVKIGETTWAGHIEIHIQSSHWYQHDHQSDPNYDNVILHVVYEDDRPVLDKKGSKVPTIELANRIDNSLLGRYNDLMNNSSWIPCERTFEDIPKIKKMLWLDRLMVERLESKIQPIQNMLEKINYDWEEAFFKSLCRTMGLKVNADAMIALASSIPLKTLLKYKHSHLQLEALLFGQAGMLDRSFEDGYPQRLQREYQMLKNKHGLTTIPSTMWKFMRLRPANFPTIRIAQMAQLIYQSNHLFSKMLAASNLKEIENMFDVKLSNYWKDHYQFDKSTTSRAKRLGKSTIQLLMINTIVPFLFVYGKYKKEEQYVEKALDLLRSCPPEQNAIIKKWKALGMTVDNAHTSQALLQLKNVYCKNQRCMSCAIGHQLMKTTVTL